MLIIEGLLSLHLAKRHCWGAVGQELSRSRVKPVWPTPARHKVRLLGFKCGCDRFNMALRIGTGRGDVDVAGHPCEIKRNERAKQVAAIECAQPVGQQEIEDDARPEALWHSKR